MSSSSSDPLALRPDDYFSSGLGRAIGNPQLQRVAPATPLGLVGEFTPRLEEDEVEILCIRLASEMGEVISVRARRVDPPTVAYHVVDEYDNEYKPGIELSEEPLTGYEVIELLRGIPSTTADLLHSYHFFEQMTSFRMLDFHQSPERVAAGHAFVFLQSDFYPDLNPWLAEWYREWLGEQTNRAAPEG